MKLTFKVHNNIVLGLKLVSVVKALKLMKDEEIVGSFPPTVESHVVEMEKMHTPSGWLARGSYDGELLFVDLDGTAHMTYKYKLTIGKDW